MTRNHAIGVKDSINFKDKDWVAILDFGSQYTHLIAWHIREIGVYSEIVPYDTDADDLLAKRPRGIILSEGPASVTSVKSPVCDRYIFSIGIPVLGICYGAQLMARFLGGVVVKARAREYGHRNIDNSFDLLLKNAILV